MSEPQEPSGQSDADHEHTQECNDNALMVHASTGDDPDCICSPCRNPYCRSGWVEYGGNESGAAPATPCKVCNPQGSP